MMITRSLQCCIFAFVLYCLNYANAIEMTCNHMSELYGSNECCTAGGNATIDFCDQVTDADNLLLMFSKQVVYNNATSGNSTAWLHPENMSGNTSMLIAVTDGNGAEVMDANPNIQVANFDDFQSAVFAYPDSEHFKRLQTNLAYLATINENEMKKLLDLLKRFDEYV